MYCGECGAFFGRKVWHSNDKYRAVVYRCNEKYNGKTCDSGHITEDEIKKLFIEEYNKLDKTKAIRNAKRLIKELTDTTELEAQMEKERKMALDYKEKIDALVDKNSRVAMDQVLYNKKKESLNLQYEKYCEKTHSIQTKIYERKDRLVQLENFIKHIKDYAITTFDEGLFCALVDKIIVYKDKAEIRWRGEIL